MSTVRGHNLRAGFGPDPWGWDRPYATEPEALCAAILASPKETP